MHFLIKLISKYFIRNGEVESFTLGDSKFMWLCDPVDEAYSYTFNVAGKITITISLILS